MKFCQERAFDAQVVADYLFVCRLELLENIFSGYRDVFRWPSTVGKDQGFFVWGQMSNFFHRFLRLSITRNSLPEENDWDRLLGFDFTIAQMLSFSQCMEKTEFQFRTKAMRAAKSRFNVERETSKKSKTDVIASNAVGDIFNRGLQSLNRGLQSLLVHKAHQSPNFQVIFSGRAGKLRIFCSLHRAKIQAAECY